MAILTNTQNPAPVGIVYNEDNDCHTNYVTI